MTNRLKLLFLVIGVVWLCIGWGSQRSWYVTDSDGSPKIYNPTGIKFSGTSSVTQGSGYTAEVNLNASGGLSDAYQTMSDGTNTSNASGGDTFRFRTTSSFLSLTVTNDDATYGDNLLINIDTATPSNGDTSHLSTADQIYDFVTGQGYLTSEVDGDTTNELQNIFQTMSDGTNTATADSTTDTFTFEAGTGISVTVDGTNDKVTITNTGDTDASDDLTTSTSFSGDVSGVYNNLQLGSGVVTTTEISDGTIQNADIADDTISEAKLDIYNSPTNGYYLKYDSTNGMEWASVSGGGGATYREITLLPSSAILDDNNPPALTIIESTGTGTPRFRVADFDSSTDEVIYFSFVMPSDYTAGSNIILDIYWFANATSGTCVWEAAISATTEADADTPLEESCATSNTASEAVNGTEANRLIKTTLTITNLDSVAAGDTVVLRFNRDADNGSDDLSPDARLRAIHVKIPRS